MQIAEHNDSSLVLDLLNEFLCVIHCRVKEFRRGLPPAVEITPSQRAAIVAINNTVRIEHWDDLENKVFSEQLSFNVGWMGEEL